MFREVARAAERAGDLRAAAHSYERVLAMGDRSLDLLLDVAILYWECTDPGVAAAHDFDAAFMNLASRRTFELLELAITQHPRSTEARFWNRYVRWLDRNEPMPTVEECEQLLLEDPSVLVPAMHVFTQTEGHRMEREAIELLRQCHASGTTRAQYVISVLDVRVRIQRARERP